MNFNLSFKFTLFRFKGCVGACASINIWGKVCHLSCQSWLKVSELNNWTDNTSVYRITICWDCNLSIALPVCIIFTGSTSNVAGSWICFVCITPSINCIIIKGDTCWICITCLQALVDGGLWFVHCCEIGLVVLIVCRSNTVAYIRLQFVLSITVGEWGTDLIECCCAAFQTWNFCLKWWDLRQVCCGSLLSLSLDVGYLDIQLWNLNVQVDFSCLQYNNLWLESWLITFKLCDLILQIKFLTL